MGNTKDFREGQPEYSNGGFKGSKALRISNNSQSKQTTKTLGLFA